MKIIYLAFCALFLLPDAVNAQRKDQRPNILLILADDASFEHFGANGSTWIKTPNFDRVARSGLLFNKAYTPNAKCSPSRASILTGRNSWQLEEIGNHLPYWPEKYLSVMELLGNNGYSSAFCGKGWAPGVAGLLNGKQRLLTGVRYDKRKLKAPTTGIEPDDYQANFNDFLASRDKSKPFFFWFGSKEPHRRYEYGSGQAMGGFKKADIDNLHKFWPDADSVRNDILDYALEVQYFDQQIGRMLAALEASGEAENTIVLITSDNGMPFPRIKGFGYEYSTHMPLAIRWPRGIKNPGRVLDDYVSFIDFTPTFLEVSGTKADPRPHNRPQGRSLTPLFLSGKSGQVDPSRNYVLLGQERHDVGRPNEAGFPIRSIIKEGMLYMRNFMPDRWPAGNPETGYLNTDGSPTKTTILSQNRRAPGTSPFYNLSFAKKPAEELYDLKKDPDCINNLATHAQYTDKLARLRDQLMRELKEQGDPRMFGKGEIFDTYPPSEGLDFYKRFLKGEKPNTNWVEPTDFETDPRIIKKR